MTGDVLAKIRDAEGKAAEIKKNASLKASEMESAAEAAGKKLCEDAEIRAASEHEEIIAAAAQSSDAVTRKWRAAAADDIDALKRKAKANMADAVKLIVEGIAKQWQ